MKKAYWLVFLTLVSCSSLERDRKVASDVENVKLEEDYNWVESLNFDKKTETKEKESTNFEIKVDSKDEALHVNTSESINTLPPLILEEKLKESDDPLSKIAIRCGQSKVEEAFGIADQVYSKYKNNASYWNQIGTCYFIKGDYSKAILFYNKSRDLDMKFSPPLNNLGVVYQKQGRFQKALSAYKKANDLNVFSITPSYNLARLYLQFGIVTKAMPILQGLFKKGPQDKDVIIALATAHLINQNYTESVNIFSGLSKDILNKPEVGLNYALALKLAGKEEEAKFALNDLTESSGEIKKYAKKVENIVRNNL